MRTLIILLLFTSVSFAQTATIGSMKLKDPIADGHYVYMDMGPLKYGQGDELDKALRVSLLKYEIYNSIYVEELHFSGGENLNVEVVNVYEVNDTEMKQAFRIDIDQGIRFDVWISWDAFVFESSAGKYIVSFMGDGIFEVRHVPEEE